MDRKSNFNKFLLLWSGEIISAIGGGLTSFGLSVYVFKQTGSAGFLADEIAKLRHVGVGRGAAVVIMASGALLTATAIILYLFKDVRALEGNEQNEETTTD
ncbi:hypothetical protein [Butyrivibrio sp. XPD2006]|uniref:hypothetical protein n=1 Tax=Butyrivibrio sp. XPD2006 TaxID=1280668 RepID=UPI0003B6F488|nr:hypothetical protein [Butyrivibrio sp. XPD2006]